MSVENPSTDDTIDIAIHQTEKNPSYHQFINLHFLAERFKLQDFTHTNLKIGVKIPDEFAECATLLDEIVLKSDKLCTALSVIQTYPRYELELERAIRAKHKHTKFYSYHFNEDEITKCFLYVMDEYYQSETEEELNRVVNSVKDILNELEIKNPEAFAKVRDSEHFAEFRDMIFEASILSLETKCEGTEMYDGYARVFLKLWDYYDATAIKISLKNGVEISKAV